MQRKPDTALVVGLYLCCIFCQLIGLIWGIVWVIGDNPHQRQHGRNALILIAALVVLGIILRILGVLGGIVSGVF